MAFKFMKHLVEKIYKVSISSKYFSNDVIRI